MTSSSSAPAAVALTTANRMNIPAVGRIPGRGTAFIISPGLLLTSYRVVGTKQEAARLKCVFFETGGKREPVEVNLLPQQFYFAAAYPDYLDYCLVACETRGIFNVAPVRLPVTRAEWATVRESDLLLCVQHPVYLAGTAATNVTPPLPATSAAASAVASTAHTTVGAELVANEAATDAPTELKRFEEVIRRRDDLIHLRPSGNYLTAGCPMFNENGDLVGLQGQQFYDSSLPLPAGGPGGGIGQLDPVAIANATVASRDRLQSRGIAISTIVKHMFANATLCRVDFAASNQLPAFDDVWQTWSVTNDVGRIVGLLLNFPHPSLAKPTSEQLFEHANRRDLAQSVASCGATRVMIESVGTFLHDGDFVVAGLRALWNASFGEVDNAKDILDANGPAVILRCLSRYRGREDVAQYAVVLLYNLSLTSHNSAALHSSLRAANLSQGGKAYPVGLPFLSDALTPVMNAVASFANSEVIQKFGIGFFKNSVACSIDLGQSLVDGGAMALTAEAMKRFPGNEYLAENAVVFISMISRCPKYQGSPALWCCVEAVILAMKRFSSSATTVRVEGNNALWGLGVDPRCRAVIFQHPDGVDVLRASIGVISDLLTAEASGAVPPPTSPPRTSSSRP